MPRKLDEKDLTIFRKLAPEYADVICPGAGHAFQSILPPVSNHVADDADDFAERIRRLSDEDWQYLTEAILKGRESLSCIPEEDVEAVLAEITAHVSEDAAERVRRLYHLSECGVL
ncbi:hypothetical protein FGU65_08760 [Methanoculleus sp. FWC-SCC1]|uniref:Uncharacterized protein n=1 Tax=Methanoculleus frigidifontis TaxID=2584085 RepID=A0ABT8MAM2_9EURY|nr:hypothetical protein [Methanoculleus sp. FWC-SCC1]MDN7024975.1 hypothetical protein [Methanoculleus sp. FWC-SCC1]